MAKLSPTPSQIRGMFGANLRELASKYASISDLSRQLGINRTQFNRYLAGESFPRPDVLARICSFFDVDARVLLEPLSALNAGDDPMMNPVLRDYIGKGARDIPADLFPDGFYSFTRSSFLQSDLYVHNLVFVWRDGSNTFVRGYEPRPAMEPQGMPQRAFARGFRGLVMQQENGIAILVSRHNTLSASFNYLSPVPSLENNYWVGYLTRTVPESIDSARATRLVYEHLGHDLGRALAIARMGGFLTLDQLPPYHKRLLRPDEPFR